MSCCCGKDPQRKCPKCFSAQTWTTLLPPTSIDPAERADGNVFFWTDLLKDGAGDAINGNCNPSGSQLGVDAGNNGFDSHTYLRIWRSDTDTNGTNFENSYDLGGNRLAMAEAGDSLVPPHNLIPEDGTRVYSKQIIGGVIWGTVFVGDVLDIHDTASAMFNVSAGNFNSYGNMVVDGFADINLYGFFTAPFNVLADGTFTKTQRSQVQWLQEGGDMSVLPGYFNRLWGFVGGTPQKLSGHRVNPFMPYEAHIFFEGNRNVPGVPLKDRPLYLRLYQSSIRGDYGPSASWIDTGLTLEDAYTTGYTLVLEIIQTTAATEVRQDVFAADFQILATIPETGSLITDEDLGTFNVEFERCILAQVTLDCEANYNRFGQDRTNDQYTGMFAGNNQGASIVSVEDAATWVGDINAGRDATTVLRATRQNIFLFPGVSDFRLDDSFTEAAAFRLARVTQTRGSSVIDSIIAADYSDFSIPDGTIWTLDDLAVGDTFEFYFDNLGSTTVEVTNVTFTGNIVTAVDTTTKSFPQFLMDKFNFTGPTAAGAAVDSVCTFTHDQNGDAIPSPFAITLRFLGLIAAGPPP